MYVLGINATFHDSAACLVKDGEVGAAAEEERFTHTKHHKRATPFAAHALPFNAIDYCLASSSILLSQVDHVAYSFDPFLLIGNGSSKPRFELPSDTALARSGPGYDPWQTIFLAGITAAPRMLVDDVPWHMRKRFCVDGIAHGHRWKFHFVNHHLAHAASAFLPSPFELAAILTIDGQGERATTTYCIGEGNQIETLGKVDLPSSLGMLYEEVTGYLGFLPSSDEYKVMALASFGKPSYRSYFRDRIRIGANGQYTIQPLDLENALGPARAKGGPIEQRHYDIAHSLQVVLEESVLELADWLHKKTNAENLCMAGGVALNCVMNARVRDRGPFKRVWVQPAAGDAGTALGAALWIDARERRSDKRSFFMDHAFLGPDYSDEEIEQFLRWSKIRYRRLTDVANETADLLAQDKVIGWFQGRMEFGPRALGARSILASPISESMQQRLNEIKDREDFRPVAPVVLEEEAAKWFVGAGVSPFMLFVYNVQPDKADRIPAVRHVDGTARIQTINRGQNPRYYDVIRAFYERTGVPILVNTSFNTRGEPIVCSPRNALECFWTSPLDALVIGSFLIEK